MKRMKRWGGLAVTLALLLGLAAVPGVQAEDEPIQITGLEQLDGIQSGSYQLAANLTIPENVILTVPSDVTITQRPYGFETDRNRPDLGERRKRDDQ